MNDNDPQNIQLILDESLVAITSGQETIDSILGKYPHLAQELRPDLEAALWLTTQRASLEPRPGFISASRARLVAEIKQSKKATVQDRRLPFLAPLTQLFQRKYALQFALIFILFIGFLSSGAILAVAANQSIPGDPLYTTKLVIEEARVATALTDIGHVQLEIRYVDHRSYELEQLFALERFEYITPTIDRFDTQVRHAVNDLDQVADTHPEETITLTASLQEIVEDQVDLLTVMAESVPLGVSGSVQTALAVTQSDSQTVNTFLQKIIIPSPSDSPTAITQTSNTPVSTPTPTLLLTEIVTSTSTSTSTLAETSTPTPTATVLVILPLYTSTPTSVEPIESEEPTDIPIQPTEVEDTSTPTESLPTNTPTPVLPTPTPTNTSTITPTPTPVPPTPTPTQGDPTDIPNPTNPVDPPDPTGIPN